MAQNLAHAILGLRVFVWRRLDRPQSCVSKYEAGERRLDLVELRAICLAAGANLTEVVQRFDHKARRSRG
jgi:hypothetical protein